MPTSTQNREELLKELGEVQMREFELQQLLSQMTVIKPFWQFRVNPGDQKVLIYAATPDQAEALLTQRMNQSYGKGKWKKAIPVVKTFHDPHEACTAAPGNLLRAISEPEAREFLADWEDNQRGRADEERPKDVPMSTLERDIEDFKIRLRMKDQN